MKPKNRKIATRKWTRSAVASRTRSASMAMMSLSETGMPSLQKQKRARPPQALSNIIGCRISHEWKEGNEPVTQWKAIVLDQLPTNPSFYLVKYDGIDCVYCLELQNDERISKLKILPNKVSFPQETDNYLENTLVGKAVEHKFEGKNGSKDGWRGVVLAQVPIMKTWFYVTYEKDPILYVYQLLDDYIDGNLRILTDVSPTEVKSEVGGGAFTGSAVQYTQGDGTEKMGKVIYQLPAIPSVHFIKFDEDTHIYVYDLVKRIS
ncbi:Y-linked testis-specific protein 1-like [Mesocricetus auratus]|uniref:Y-linked testis-specific protein 1-like n=1 Tax=Mesocricetus auratus TaxID=10036 RepID=A0ABM2W7V9_MESAU|nr:Y-linked testis-specific protein 1-like [Mesocricetus auratus]